MNLLARAQSTFDYIESIPEEIMEVSNDQKIIKKEYVPSIEQRNIDRIVDKYLGFSDNIERLDKISENVKWE